LPTPKKNEGGRGGMMAGWERNKKERGEERERGKKLFILK
jgi:hypothetical protein